MRLTWRRRKGPTEFEIDYAFCWNRWEANCRRLWQETDRMPQGPERTLRLAEVIDVNDAMWQMDPDLWDCVTRDWPAEYRRHNLREAQLLRKAARKATGNGKQL